MFSQALPPAQVAAALSQVTTVISHLRHGLSATSFPKNTSRPASTAVSGSTQNINLDSRSRQRKGNYRKAYSKKKALPNLDVNECVSELLKEENLSKILPLLSVTADSLLQPSYWSTSYVSSNTFYENRNGFPETSLERREKQILHLLGMGCKPSLQVPAFLEQRRFYGVQGFGMRKHDSPKKKGDSDKFATEAEAAKHISDSILSKIKEVNVTLGPGQEKSRTKEIWNIMKLALALYLVFYILLPSLKGSDMAPGPLEMFQGNEFEGENVAVSFDDVRGVDEAKQELQEAVEFLKYPEKFRAIGAKLPKGVLLVGQPGIGKTLLAKAVAGEAGVPFFYASGAAFDDLFVGSGARKVRKIFAKARLNAPCVIFIDEIDSAGAKRTNSTIHPYANQTINQLLSDMDGFNSTTGIIVIGATNKRENLDEALLRPGRFDVEVHVRPPDTKGREDIFRLYLEKVQCDPNLNIERLAEASVGMTGADISNVVNQAALNAAIAGKKVVSWEDLDESLDKSRMGPAWKNKRLKKKELECTAYHEAGHTLMVLFSKDAPELNKVTILPRGRALGLTSFLPESDAYSQSKIQMLTSIDIAMGGRVAEELIYGADRVTSGASSDFRQATNIATNMVKQLGMSEKAGFRTHDGNRGEMISVNESSPDHQQMIDHEIDRILNESYERTKSTLSSHKRELERLAKALITYGTLDREEVIKVIKGQKIEREPDAILKERNITSS